MCCVNLSVRTDSAYQYSTELFGIWVVNKSTNEKVGGTQAFLKKSADNKVGKKLGDRSFEVQVLDYTDR